MAVVDPNTTLAASSVERLAESTLVFGFLICASAMVQAAQQALDTPLHEAALSSQTFL